MVIHVQCKELTGYKTTLMATNVVAHLYLSLYRGEERRLHQSLSGL